jgi:LemA protein
MRLTWRFCMLDAASSERRVQARLVAEMQRVRRMNIIVMTRSQLRARTIWFGVLFALGGCWKYNQLVTADQECERTWADVEAELERRCDLVPNLIATVKGSARHEEQTLAQVVQARSQATSIKMSSDDLQDPEKMAAFQKAQDQLKGSLSRLLLVQEQYPDLKANAAFHDLQIQLEGTENRILRAREEFNRAVGAYNAEIRKVSGVMVNKVTGKTFKLRPFFRASAESQTVPKVLF